MTSWLPSGRRNHEFVWIYATIQVLVAIIIVLALALSRAKYRPTHTKEEGDEDDTLIH